MGSPAITISIIAETSQIRAQLAEANATLKSTTAAFVEAQQAVMAQGVGTEQATKIMAGYRAEMAAADANVAALKSQLDGLTSTETRATTSMRGLTAATGLAGRELGGGMGAALGRVVAQTGLFGGAIEALMPAVLGFAAVDVFGHMIEQAVDAYNNFISLDAVDQKLFEDVQKLSRADFINVHSIETANARLKEATEYASTLRELSDQVHGSGWSQILSGDIAGGAANLAAAHAMRQQSSEDQKQSIALDTHKLGLQHATNLLQIEANHAADGGLEGQAKINAELAKKLALNKEDQEYTSLRDRLAGNAVPADAGDSDRGLKDAIARGEARGQEMQQAKQANEQRLRAMETAFAQERAAQNLSVFQELTFWRDRENAFLTGSSEYLSVLNKVVELESDAHRKEEAALKQKIDEQRRDAGEQIRIMGETSKEIEKFEQAIAARDLHLGKPFDDAYIESMKEAQRGYDDLAKSIDSAIQSDLRMGTISAQTALQRERDAEITRFNAKSNSQNDELDQLTTRNQAQQGMDKSNPGYDPSLPDKILALNGQIEQEEQQHNLKMQQLDQQSLQQRESGIKNFFQSTNQEFTSQLDSWMRGQESFGRALSRTFDQMAVSAINSLVRIGLQMAETWLLGEIFGQQSQTSTLTKTLATNEVMAQSNAAVAATLALATTADPAYAAAIFATAEGFAAMAAFDSGTSYVPRDGVAMIHKGEYIMPAAQSEILREALSGRGSGGPQSGSGSRSIGTVNLHYQGGRSSGPDEMMAHFGKWARRANLTTRT